MNVTGINAAMGVRVGSLGMRCVMMRMGRVVMGVSLEDGGKFAGLLSGNVILRRRVRVMRRLVRVIGLRMTGSHVVMLLCLARDCSVPAGNARIAISNARR
jgi:hypothetical protein